MQVKLNNAQKLLLAKSYLQLSQSANEIIQDKLLTADQIKPTANYLDCLILLEPEKVIKANCFAHCQFVYKDENQYDNYLRVRSDIAFPFCRNSRRISTTAALDSNVKYPRFDSFNVLTLHNIYLEEAFYKTYGSRLIEYQDRHFAFDYNQIIAGVELELPVYADTSRYYKRLFSNFWAVDTDESQISGDLELQTMPAKIDYFTSGMFKRRLRTVYKHFVDSSNDVPSESHYVRDGGNKGSGIHMHVGLPCSAFSAVDLRNALYDVAAECGGVDFLMKIGGKKKTCFNQYSPFEPTRSNPKHKYQAFRVIRDTSTEKRVEIRYMASSPDYDVVFNRIVNAVLLVERAIAWLENREAENFNKALTEFTLLRARSLRV